MSPTAARRARSLSKRLETPAKPPRPFVAHHLVPPHELLSEAESQAMIAQLKVLPERLPRILSTDPGLRTDPKYEAMRETHEPIVGRLVRIRRPSSTAGEAIAYRIIVGALEE